VVVKEEIEIANGEMIRDLRQGEDDTCSCEVQIALLTERIRCLTEYLDVPAKDFHSVRGLVALANRGTRRLAYLKRTNLD
jgi:small subunit ribosomal protein S15